MPKLLKQITLYHRPSCGYCRRVYRALEEMDISIEQINLNANDQARAELYKGGGMTQVPAIRIDLADGTQQWMYESLDIIEFLRKQAR